MANLNLGQDVVNIKERTLTAAHKVANLTFPFSRLQEFIVTVLFLTSTSLIYARKKREKIGIKRRNWVNCRQKKNSDRSAVVKSASKFDAKPK